MAQIKEAFTTSGPSPNLCRCGTYVAIMEAVQHASTIMAKGRVSDDNADRKTTNVLGATLSRREFVKAGGALAVGVKLVGPQAC